MLVATVSKELAEYIQNRFSLKLNLIDTTAPTADAAKPLADQRVLLLKRASDVELMLKDRSTFPFEDYAIRYVPNQCA